MTDRRATPAYVQWIITVLAAVMTIALTAVAFWLSYEHLHDVADAHGLAGARAWAWPATLDTFIVIGEALILRASLQSSVDIWAWILTAIGSVGSITLNITGVGTGGDALDYTVAAVPPVAALLAFGMLMRQLHSMIVKYMDAGPKITPGAETVPPGQLVFDGTDLVETPAEASEIARASVETLIAAAFDVPVDLVSNQSRPVWDEATARGWDDLVPTLSAEPGVDAMRHVPRDSETEGHEDETTGWRGLSVSASVPVPPVPAYVPVAVPAGPETAGQGHGDSDMDDLVSASYGTTGPRPAATTGITATVREMLTADFGTPDDDVYASFGPETDRKSVRKSITRVRKELNRP